MKSIARHLFLFTMLVLPFSALAQTATDAQAQTQILLQKVSQLQAQLGAGNNSNTNTSVNTSACPNIGRSLKLGSIGDDVTRLQHYLAQDPGVYPEGIISRRFGNLTQVAVARWQVKYNIVAAGSPSTTGYGMVGPRTAAAIALLCSTHGGGSSPAVGGYLQVTPYAGSAPLTVQVVANVNSALSCAGGSYVLDFGDNSGTQSIPVAQGDCTQLSQSFTHIYTMGGTYQITLGSGTHQTHATVTVTGNSNPVGQGNTLFATPNVGNAPLVVTFTGSVNSNDVPGCNGSGCIDTIVFGDGTTGVVPLSSNPNVVQTYSITHTYTTGGVYNALLYRGAAGNGNAVSASANVTVSGSVGGTGTYSIGSVTATGVANQVSVQLGVPSCPTYTLDWGDSTTPVSGTPNSGCNPSGIAITPSYTHTFTTAGVFTIALKDVNNVVRASAAVTISN